MIRSPHIDSDFFAQRNRPPPIPHQRPSKLFHLRLSRALNSLGYQLKSARFPVHRDLTGIDWAETPLPQARIQQLASAAFMETAHNLILVGGTDPGS